MENEQTMPVQGCTNCDGKGCGKCCGKWSGKRWAKNGGSAGCGGGMWVVGWLFTLGFLKLTFWKGVLALVLWPYYLGSFLAQ